MALLHRSFTLLVLLVGVGLGIPIGRFWAEVPEAEAAARRATFQCLAPGFIQVHNASDRTVEVRAEFLGAFGDRVNEVVLELGPRDFNTASSADPGRQVVAYVTAPATTLVQGWDEGAVPCRIAK